MKYMITRNIYTKYEHCTLYKSKIQVKVKVCRQTCKQTDRQAYKTGPENGFRFLLRLLFFPFYPRQNIKETSRKHLKVLNSDQQLTYILAVAKKMLMLNVNVNFEVILRFWHLYKLLRLLPGLKQLTLFLFWTDDWRSLNFSSNSEMFSNIGCVVTVFLFLCACQAASRNLS